MIEYFNAKIYLGKIFLHSKHELTNQICEYILYEAFGFGDKAEQN